MNRRKRSPPPQPRKKHKKAKGHKKTRRARAPRAARPTPKPAAAERFIPAVDAASRLIIVNGAEPLIFSDEQTEAIASLLFQHYDKKA